MLKPSGSLMFPFETDLENDCLKRAHTIEDTLMSCIRCFLVTRKGERLGSNIGSFLPELLLQNIPKAKLPSLANELKDELSNQFPGVQFTQVTMERDLSNQVSELIVKISFTTPIQTTIQEMSLNLPSLFSREFSE